MIGIGIGLGIGFGGAKGSTTPPVPIPVNTSPPVITGNTVVGSVLTVTPGTYTNSPTSRAYQWRNAGVAIPGETNTTYTSVVGDVGDAIDCTEVASNAGGSAAPVDSNDITVTAAPTTSFKNFAALFAGGADGLMIDLTDKTTLFQDANGILPVVNNGDPVGLALDQHKWGGLTLAAYRASQSELVTNGDFSGGFTGWTGSSGSGLTLVNSRIRIENDGGSGKYLYQSKNVTPGRWYEISVDAYTGTGTAKIRVGQSGSLGNLIDAGVASDGLHRRFFKPTATPIVINVASTGATGTYVEFDNISVKEIDGHHATQSGAARPTWDAANSDVAFDGSADFLITDYVAGANANLMGSYFRMATTSGQRAIAGALSAGPPYAYMGMRTSALTGYVYLGNVSMNTLESTTVINGMTGTLFADRGSSTTELFVNGVQEKSLPSAGTPSSLAWYIGAGNNGGNAGNFTIGGIKRIIAVQARAQDTMPAADIHANLIAA